MGKLQNFFHKKYLLAGIIYKKINLSLKLHIESICSYGFEIAGRRCKKAYKTIDG